MKRKPDHRAHREEIQTELISLSEISVPSVPLWLFSLSVSICAPSVAKTFFENKHEQTLEFRRRIVPTSPARAFHRRRWRCDGQAWPAQAVFVSADSAVARRHGRHRARDDGAR